MFDLACLTKSGSFDKNEPRGTFDCEVALEIIRKKLPNLVILDVNMPRLNGMEVCKAIRSDEQTTETSRLYEDFLYLMQDKKLKCMVEKLVQIYRDGDVNKRAQITGFLSALG